MRPPHKKMSDPIEYKDVFLPYRNFHCGDKMILWPSYLHNGISCDGKDTESAPRFLPCCLYYRKTSNISHTSVGNKIVDNSDVVGASPVGAAPTTSSFST